ncbi:hypothetical protein [Haloarchaeobius sp. DFWS5]|uniref:hypothetical protein n=1 Tax=Haloarchaeobius sp. DFWS5 TaxID=3446114 RepID=UPI003EBAE940
MARGSWAVQFDEQRGELLQELQDVCADYDDPVVEAALSKLLYERRLREAKMTFSAEYTRPPTERKPLSRTR